MKQLKDKTIVLGVTGGIAAYKAAELISLMKKQGAIVHVIMTKAACEFITPLTLETLSCNRVVTDTFERNPNYEVEHVSLAQKADAFVVAPATANFLGKLAGGIADDMLSTTAMATRAPLVVAPAMNTVMYESAATQHNLEVLGQRGVCLVDPEEGLLACGDVGRGRLAPLEQILHALYRALTPQDLAGRHVLVTAGPTQEAMDPVRYLTNHSTGKMGYAIAGRAALRGARVTLVSGPVSLKTPLGVERVDVKSARQMYDAVVESAPEADWIIKAAAVGDYRPAHQADNKLKKQDGELSVALERNPDILQQLGQQKKPGQLLCGFSMETQDLLENSQKKLEKKNCDLLVANDLNVAGAGFATDTNVVTLLHRDGGVQPLPLMDKDELAERLLDEMQRLASKQ